MDTATKTFIKYMEEEPKLQISKFTDLYQAGFNDPLTGLPQSPIPILGREIELGKIFSLLQNTNIHLLTLLGPGGVGKTRLALEVALNASEWAGSNIYFVSLASLSNTRELQTTLVRSLDLHESSSGTAFEVLINFFYHKTALLVLDNFEHLIEAAGEIANLLARCPHLKILVTSREVLNIQAENVFKVNPFPLPKPALNPSTQQLKTNPAVKFFLERARAYDGDWEKREIRAKELTTIAEICRRLDGLPLAIELAARRSRLLDVQEILERLKDSSLKLLTDGERDLPSRQRTLRTAIDWSYNLLDEPEKRLLRNLSVFAGGWDFKGGAMVCGMITLKPMLKDSIDPRLDEGYFLNLLAAMVEKSLVVKEVYSGPHVNESPLTRYYMLETIREYAQEKLRESGEADDVRLRHALYYTTLAKELEAPLLEGDHLTAQIYLARELNNLRIALNWTLKREEFHYLGLELGAALHWFWYLQGYLSEGQYWTEQILTQVPSARRSAAGAKLLFSLGGMHWLRAEFSLGRRYLEEALAINRDLGEQLEAGLCLAILGLLERDQGNHHKALAHLQEALALGKTTASTRLTAWAQGNLGAVKGALGELAAAQAHLEEAVKLWHELGHNWGIAMATRQLVIVLLQKGDFQAVSQELSKVLNNLRLTGDKFQIAICLNNLAAVENKLGHPGKSIELFKQSLLVNREVNDKRSMAFSLASLSALIAGQRGSSSLAGQAALLLGAAQSLLDETNAWLDPALLPDQTTALDKLGKSLGQEALKEALREGRSMNLSKVLDLVEKIQAPPRQENRVKEEQTKVPSPATELTQRELEVLQLVAEGLSNAQIATKLVISVRTVDSHLTSIYLKLGINSRSAATNYALKNDLA